MVILDETVRFVSPSNFRVTDRVTEYLEERQYKIPAELMEETLIPTFAIGRECTAFGFSICLGFEIESELDSEARRNLSDDGILVAIPIKLKEDELLTIDIDGDVFFHSGVNLDEILERLP